MKPVLCLVLLIAAISGISASKKVVCYFTNWSFYRLGVGKFLPSNIDPKLCTHILYAFAVVEGNRLKIYDTWADVDKEHYKLVGDVRKANPSVKVLVAVGGWNAGSVSFSNMAKTAATRKIFVDSVVDFMDRFDYDGIDLDWEYPAKRGGVPEDKENFSLLIKDLQKRFRQLAQQRGQPKMLVTAAVGPAPHTASVAYDIPTICRELDFVNLMNYDIHGSWESKTGYAAPLFAGPKEVDPQNMVDTMTRDWIKAGCETEQLIFGIPLYGRGWNLQAGAKPEIGAAGNPSTPGQYTRASGILSYYEICNNLNNGWVESYDSIAVQAIATGDGQWFSYDNERVIKTKINYIKAMQLGGAMVWALDFDDFTGQFCGKGPYPLLSLISQGMQGNTTGIIPTPVTVKPTTQGYTTSKPVTKYPTTMGPTTQKPVTESPVTGNPVTVDPVTEDPGTVTEEPVTIDPVTSEPETEKPVTQGSTTAGPPTYSSEATAAPGIVVTEKPTTGCEPPCNSSMLTFLEDRCNPKAFYMCYAGTTWRMDCAPGTVFSTWCSCCLAE